MAPDLVQGAFRELAREPQLTLISKEVIALHWPAIETYLEEALFTGTKTPREVRDAYRSLTTGNTMHDACAASWWIVSVPIWVG